jgi:hypothetical protein
VGIAGKGESTRAADMGMHANHRSFKEAAPGAVDHSKEGS